MSDCRIMKMVVGMVMTNCYIVYHEDTREAFIVDPGDDARRISHVIREQNLILKAILLTHGHFDHMLAVPELKGEFEIPVYAHEAEQELLSDPAMNLSGDWVGRPTKIKADILLKDGQEFTLAGFRIQAIYTPGHTIGGISYYIEEEQVLFCGDTLFCGSYGRTDLPTASETDMDRSVNEKLLVLPENTAAYPGHDRETTIGFERVYNPLSRGNFT